MVVQLMIEDIWSNLDNYMLQRKVMKQSQDFKKTKHSRHESVASKSKFLAQ